MAIPTYPKPSVFRPVPDRADAYMKDLQWFRDRRRAMLPGELSTRVVSMATRQVWRRAPALVRSAHRPAPSQHHPVDEASTNEFVPFAYEHPEAAARHARSRLKGRAATCQLVDFADGLLNGHAEVLGTIRFDLKHPDWDSKTTPTLPDGLDHEVFPSAKHRWELSRGNVLTQLAVASFVTGEPKYFDHASKLLVDWCEHFASPEGPMWESGVELGIRMQSWSWMRRLNQMNNALDYTMGETLDYTPTESRDGTRRKTRVVSPFNASSVRRSIVNHLEILRRFPSSHSSANNHRLLEAAGLFTGGCCFADLVDSELARDARETGLRILVEELQLQVTAAGLHREQATDYHCFVLEAAFFALLEAELHQIEIPDHAWNAVHRMADALHAICDPVGVGPHFGDSDNSHVVQLDAPHDCPSIRALTLMAEVAGGPGSGRRLTPDIRSAVVAAVADTAIAPHRRGLQRPDGVLTDRIRLAEDGLIVMSSASRSPNHPELWMALRSGPLGYLPIAAHAHADLNSVEVRVGGIPFVIDPGTFGYGEDPFLREVFRTTTSHSTVTVHQQNQARYAGPFLWSTEALGYTTVTLGHLDDPSEPGGIAVIGCTSTHDGFARNFGGPLHQRSIAVGDSVVITDTLLEGTRQNNSTLNRPTQNGDQQISRQQSRLSATERSEEEVELHFLIHGDWAVELDGRQLLARHMGFNDWSIAIHLDPALQWQTHGALPSGLGWHAPRYGVLQKATSLRGTGRVALGVAIQTTLTWLPVTRQES